MLISSCGKLASPPITVLVPQIVSTEVIPEENSVALYASISGMPNLTGCGFGIAKDGLIREYPAVLDREKMSFSATPDGLEPETNYGFYAFIANGTSRIQTPERVFRTLARQPDGREEDTETVSFLSVHATPGTSSAILGAELSSTDDVTSCGFSISADGQSFTDHPATLEGKGFSLVLDGLEPETNYSFAAWAIQKDVRVSSDVKVFITEKEVHNVSFTGTAAVPGAFSAMLNAEVDDVSYVEYCGFGLSREGKTPAEFGAILEGNAFTFEATGLIPETEYVCYAFIVVDGGRVTSDFFRFTTLEDPAIHFFDIGAQAGAHNAILSARLSRTSGVTEAGFGLALEGGDFVERAATPGTDGSLSLNWEFLEADSHYLFYVYAVTAEGRQKSETLELYTQMEPYTDINFVSVMASPEGTLARLKTVLTGVDGIELYGFGVGENPYDFVEYNAALTADGFEKLVPGLASGKTYYYYAFFTLNGNYHRSETYSFTMP